jgi:UDP-N-acetylglucosamine:LPS N-acetylglucosamine transferase
VTPIQAPLPVLPADARILLVGSSGGHLAQLMALAPLWRREQRFWVTFDTVDAESLLVGEDVTWAYHPTTRNVKNLLRNTAQARRVMQQVRPDIVVSTGAAVAYPYFLLARAEGIPRFYLEVYDRIDSSTLTGRLCRPHASVFAVQWPEQQRLYQDSVVVGPVL